jgi:outer membrane murein-binding lipoprotein Lpp
MTAHPEATTSDGAAVVTDLISEAGAVLGGVADTELHADVTRRMLQAIYRLSLPLMLVPPVAGAVAYARFVGFGWGFAGVCIGAVALGGVLLIGLRLLLGFGWLVLRFLDQLAQLPAAVLSLNSQVDQLRDQVAELGGGVSELREDVAPLSSVVQGLRPRRRSAKRSDRPE